jgi:hypothetical protein
MLRGVIPALVADTLPDPKGLCARVLLKPGRTKERFLQQLVRAAGILRIEKLLLSAGPSARVGASGQRTKNEHAAKSRECEVNMMRIQKAKIGDVLATVIQRALTNDSRASLR